MSISSNLVKGDALREQAAGSHAPPAAALPVRLERMILAELGPGHEVRACAPMADGHAGLTWGFEVAGPLDTIESFVLKLSPTGVPRQGSTDIFRQAPLLKALRLAGQPVPDIRWASPSEEQLGAPFIIMQRLLGRSMVIWQPHSSFLSEAARLPSLWTQTAAALGSIHRFDWQRDLADWEPATSLPEELLRWRRLLRHTTDERWLALATTLFDALNRSIPVAPKVGLIHGDPQPGNVLFHDGRLTGFIDWDLAAIAPQGIDVGWLLMMGDADSWAQGWKPAGPPPRSTLLDAYVEAGGTVIDAVGWYQAFAHARMAAIAGLNLKLHRTGRRPDEAWERFVPSIFRLLERGPDLI